MKAVQKELLSISKALASLVTKVEKMVEAIDAQGGKAAPAKKAKATKKKAKAPAKKKAKKAAKAKSAPKKRAAKKKAAPKAAAKAAASSSNTMLDNILGMINRSRTGITVERLKKRTGLAPRQVSNALYKLTKKGKIETLSRGVYVKKKS